MRLAGADELLRPIERDGRADAGPLRVAQEVEAFAALRARNRTARGARPSILLLRAAVELAGGPETGTIYLQVI